ncbi:MAG TPA: uracil-DNA glycosylase [Longimicrobiales bacterium]|nr:uracil-DNA glycosylase [Longimicrobiales bacterium]
MIGSLPASWRKAVGAEASKPYFRELDSFLEREAREHRVLPEPPLLFRALELTRPADVRAVIIGQDPYPNSKHAEGLCFSVPVGVKPPVSLRNVLKELHDDFGCATPPHGHLAAWAANGVLLLNAVLTVRAGKPGSHRGKGWEHFTDAVLAAVVRKRTRVVFLLWGNDAQRKAAGVGAERHTIVTGSHPSFYSAAKGFFGSRPFSRTNEALVESGRQPIDWCAIG